MAPKPKHAIHPVHGYKMKPMENLKTIKRNQRERHRVQNLNNGFEILRQNIPAVAAMKKMSKIQILGHAVGYIQHLHHLLGLDQHQVKQEAGYEAGYSSYTPYYCDPLSPGPGTPVSPAPTYDSDTSGVFSDYSLHSPVWPHHHQQQQQQQQQHQHQQYSLYQQQHQVSSTTEQISSDEEDDVIEAIAEWQHIQ